MKNVIIHTDGACSGNPGPGGWSAILIYEEHEKEIAGGSLETTNNQMELTAAIEALDALKEPCEVELHSDSEYVVKGMIEWIHGWKANRWRNSRKKPVENKDLWQQLDRAASRHKVEWFWEEGHAGNEYNERCDRLARAQIEKYKK